MDIVIRKLKNMEENFFSIIYSFTRSSGNSQCDANICEEKEVSGFQKGPFLTGSLATGSEPTSDQSLEADTHSQDSRI